MFGKSTITDKLVSQAFARWRRWADVEQDENDPDNLFADCLLSVHKASQFLDCIAHLDIPHTEVTVNDEMFLKALHIAVEGDER